MENTKSAPCKNCDGGTMYRKKKYVLGVGGAIIRFLFMVPGVIFLLIGIMGVVGGGAGAAATAEVREENLAEFKVEYAQKGLPVALIDDILEDGTYDGDTSSMSTNAQSLIMNAETEYLGLNIGTAGAGVASAAVGGLGVAGIITGLILCSLGLLIGIRKWKLICDTCGTALNAA